MQNKSIKPKRFVNYTELHLFMSALAHDYKRYGLEGLKERYNNNKFRGMYKRYYNGYIEYLYNMENNIKIECKEYPEKLIVDFDIHEYYFDRKNKYEHKRFFLEESLKYAVPELLNKGFLIVEVHEAVPAVDYHPDRYKWYREQRENRNRVFERFMEFVRE